MTTLPFSYHELLETFPERGCAFCNLLRAKVERYLDHLLYERVTRPATHEVFGSALGLCATHGELLLTAKGSALGISILYQTSLKAGLDGLKAAGTSYARGGRKRLSHRSPKYLSPASGCPACQQMLEIEQILIVTLREFADNDRLMEAYRQSDGLCLPHVRLLMESGISGAARDQLVSLQADHWRSLLAELETFIAKHDYRMAKDEFGDERDSWRRVVRLVSGDPVVFGVRRTAK